MSEHLIEIENLTFYRGERAIFKNVDMRIPRGQITAIMGPSGTGKTTLLRIIGGQLRPHEGKVIIDGKDISRMKRKDLFAVRRHIGMLFQSSALFTDLSVYENVAFPMRVHTDLSEELIRAGAGRTSSGWLSDERILVERSCLSGAGRRQFRQRRSTVLGSYSNSEVIPRENCASLPKTL